MTGYQMLVQKARSGESDAGDDRPASWKEAPAPAQVAEKLSAGVFDTELPLAEAGSIANRMHWSYGTLWGTIYGIAKASFPATSPQKPGRYSEHHSGQPHTPNSCRWDLQTTLEISSERGRPRHLLPPHLRPRRSARVRTHRLRRASAFALSLRWLAGTLPGRFREAWAGHEESRADGFPRCGGGAEFAPGLLGVFAEHLEGLSALMSGGT